MRPAEKRVVAVVDDDPTTRRILRHWLGAEGYERREFADAPSALAADMREFFRALYRELAGWFLPGSRSLCLAGT